ncbi:MAG: radical SAM protein [Planctomycetia bacterium]|nr:radical SAM protein [Planctomycetia bacterium]
MLVSDRRAPRVRLSHLDDLWFQVAGTLCNLTCRHCFISCSPRNDKFGFLSLDQVRRALRDSVELGVKEYYFTGGEPFMNRDIVPILSETLRYGPATVLTNATLFKDAALSELAAAERESPYSLEFRVSIDGFSPETNDPIRGEGTFERAMHGVAQLVDHGFLPIITAARTWPLGEEHAVVGRFVETLRAAGYARPRLKIIPTLKIGAEETRTCGYQEDDRVTPEMMQGYDASQLICEHSRVVTDQGVYVCPILLDFPAARVGDDLHSARGEFPLAFGACLTCYEHGAICTNPSAAGP